MNKYFPIKTAQMVPLNSRLEMPSILVICAGLLAASPLGATLLSNNAMPLPASLAQLFGLLNGLVLERYFYRAMMTAGYIVQNQSKVMAAIPLAFKIVCEAIERIILVLFIFPASLYFSIRKSAVDFERHFKVSRAALNDRQVEIGGRVKRELQALQVTDDFFWHSERMQLKTVIK